MLSTVNFSEQKTRIQRMVIVCIAFFLLLSGCAPRYSTRSHRVNTPQLPSTQIYFHPLHGQSKVQQERDRYDCYVWAVRQSGFDPNQQGLAPHQRVEVRPLPPSGESVAAGAMTGAMIGSMVSPWHHSGEGLVFGAIAGALLGAAADALQHNQQANRVQQQYDANNARNYARYEKRARDYRRAMSACLDGRGYSVQ